MLVNWIEVRSKVTHFGALILAWFWTEYTLNDAFKNGVDNWCGSHPFLKALLGVSISFYAWYRNPKRKDSQ